MLRDPVRAVAVPRPLTGRTVLFAAVAFFGVVAAMNAVMIFLAVKSFPGLEVDSSYRAGLHYPEELVAARTQAGLGWHVAARAVRHPDGGVDVAVTVADRNGAPIAGLAAQALLKRPADAAMDRPVALAEAESGRYSGAVAGAAPGLYDLVVTLDGGDGRAFRSVNRLVLAGEGA